MAATTYPIDPRLPQRDPYGSASNQDGMSEQNFANLVDAVNATENNTTSPTIEPRKRKRADAYSDDSDNDLSIPKRTKPYGVKYPYSDREASPFLIPAAKNAGPDPSNALFRKVLRAPAKKYTRPPTKDVFQSLRIGTEEWVRLEAEAKAFMLDETHPERQAGVGNRGAVPTNDTKIQLFKTVQKFLTEGAGECYFGVGVGGNVEGNRNREEEGEDEVKDRWIYPRDEDKLIGLLTPLMRRMVTNERQRQYARRTRQGGVGSKDVESEKSEGIGLVKNTPIEQTTAKSPPTGGKALGASASDASFPSNATQLIYINPSSQILYRQILPRPNQTSYTNLLTTINTHLLSTTASRLNLPGFDTIISPSEPQATIDSSVNEQVRTVREAYQTAFEAHKTALQKAALAAAAQVCPSFEVEVHGVRGLIKISDERAWRDVVGEVEGNAWMAGWIRVLVRINDG